MKLNIGDRMWNCVWKEHLHYQGDDFRPKDLHENFGTDEKAARDHAVKISLSEDTIQKTAIVFNGIVEGYYLGNIHQPYWKDAEGIQYTKGVEITDQRNQK